MTTTPDTPEIQQHLGRLRGYLALMTENNWHELSLRCKRQLNALERAVALQAIDDVIKPDIRLVEQRERRWCKSCGTVTRTDECDCTTFEDTATAQNLVNYADAILEDREELIAQRDALLRALDGVIEWWDEDGSLEGQPDFVKDARAAIKAAREG